MKQLIILYENNFVIIADKPAGLAVQGGKGVKYSADNLLAEMYKPVRPLLVHRLDKDTSGVLLTAKNKESAARFSSLISDHQKTIKLYTAVCFGCPKEEKGVISADLEIHGAVKKAVTEYKVINKVSLSDYDYSVLEIKLGTGRMHQIRRHLAMIGCPILGDDKYGNFKLNKKFKLKRLMLHAHRLAIKEADIDVSAPLPIDISCYFSENES